MQLSLLQNIRFYVLLSAFFLSLGIWSMVRLTISPGTLFTIRLEQWYGFISVGYLYITLLTGPFCYTFPSVFFKKPYLKARRALGVASWYFALLHSSIAFFGQLGGFNGLAYLTNNFLSGIILGAIGLFILFLLAATSFDVAVERLTFLRWKLLHRLVYFATAAILLHIVILGSHYQNFSGIIPQISFFAFASLLLLESPRFDRYIQKFLPSKISIGFVLTAIVLAYVYGFYHTDSSKGNGLNIHSSHIQLALQAAQNQFSTSQIPGLGGDRTLRYSARMDILGQATANQDITLQFKVFAGGTGAPVGLFKILYTKPMHLIIVNNDLTFYEHLHPVQNGYVFTITTQLPKDDIYHVYIDFQPFGGIEQQFGFILPVGDITRASAPLQTGEDVTKKVFGDSEVSLDTNGQLRADGMSLGQQLISFTLRDAKTRKPITSLKPYLGAFGHLVMINEKDYSYLHVHPTTIIPPPPDANGGPRVDFIPIGIYGPFKPGLYRIFAQFNPDGKLFTADFTVKVR